MQILELYPTPVYADMISRQAYDEVQKDFERVFQELQDTDTFKPRQEGEHKVSDTTFSKNMIAEFNLKAFQDEIDVQVKRYLSKVYVNGGDINNVKYRIIDSWMTLTEHNEFAPMHDHGTADISGVYYFKTSGKDGSIYFESPLRQLKSSFVYSASHPRMSLNVQEGLFLLFPGWLEHGTMRNTTNDQRMSISFNIYLER